MQTPATNKKKLDKKLLKMKGHIKVWKSRKHCKTHSKTHISTNPKGHADQKTTPKKTKFQVK